MWCLHGHGSSGPRYGWLCRKISHNTLQRLWQCPCSPFVAHCALVALGHPCLGLQFVVGWGLHVEERKPGCLVGLPEPKHPSYSGSNSRGWGSTTQSVFQSSTPPRHLGLSCGHSFVVFPTWVRQTGSQSQSSLTKSRTCCCSMTFWLVTRTGLSSLPPPFRAASPVPAAQTRCRQLHEGCTAQPFWSVHVGLLQAGREQSLKEVTATLFDLWGLAFDTKLHLLSNTWVCLWVYRFTSVLQQTIFPFCYSSGKSSSQCVVRIIDIGSPSLQESH